MQATMHLKAVKDLLLVVLLLISSCILSPCLAENFYVTPTLPAAEPCPPPCYTLDQYAQNSSLFANQANITLIFLGGNHSMNYDLTLSGDDIILQPQSLSPNEAVIYNVDIMGHTITLVLHSGQFIVLEKLTFVRVDVDVVVYIDSNRSSITFHRCVLNYGNLSIFGGLFGLGINITISDSVFDGDNDGDYAGDNAEPVGISISGVVVGESTLTLCNSSITHYYGGLYIFGNVNSIIENTTISHSEQSGLVTIGSNVTIINSSIIYNQIGISLLSSITAVWSSLISSNGVGIVIIDVPNLKINSSIEMDGCHVTQNSMVGVSLYFQEMAVFRDCTFDYNTGSSIFAYQSKFELSRNTVFSNNKAERGCGMALYQSTVTFSQGSDTLFENNTATEYGGGIYIEALPLPLPQYLVTVENTIKTSINSKSCFYSTGLLASVRFSNNSAHLGGTSIFGLSTSSYTSTCPVKQTIFEFDQSKSLDFQLSSNPTRVCFCLDNKPQCSNRSMLVLNETRYPGEMFYISVVVVGFNYGRAVGTVFANVLDNTGTLDKAQRSQMVDYTQCSNLAYTVSSSETNSETNNRKATVALVVNEPVITTGVQKEVSIRNAYSLICLMPCKALLTAPVYIDIKLESCPLGFELNAKGVCSCDGSLLNYFKDDDVNLFCDIYNRNGYISREGTVWVGVDTSQNNTDVYYWHRYCPRDYCNTSTTRINVKSPDTQCSMNRVGVLCGSCQANYSLKLGGNKCEQCVDSFLGLLIVFMTLGILLVAFIKFLDITVSTGTINGLIFYANVIWMNN